MGLAMQELTHSPVAFAPGMGTPGMVTQPSTGVVSLEDGAQLKR